jgi:hypothetical protein
MEAHGVGTAVGATDTPIRRSVRGLALKERPNYRTAGIGLHYAGEDCIPLGATEFYNLLVPRIRARSRNGQYK